MEGKLIKTENGYGLKDCELIAFVSSRRPEHKHHKLSLTNCQAIERGYDLDELAIKNYPNNNFYGQTSIEQKERQKAFVKGCETMIELMGDKKFSGRDLEKAIIWAHDKSTEGVYLSRLPITEFFQSLQQNEWDVTFNPEELDAEGCLILKRKL